MPGRGKENVSWHLPCYQSDSDGTFITDPGKKKSREDMGKLSEVDNTFLKKLTNTYHLNSKGIWRMPSLICSNFWLALKWSDSWT